MYYSNGNYEAFARPEKPANVDIKLPWFASFQERKGLKKVHGTYLEELLRDAKLI